MLAIVSIEITRCLTHRASIFTLWSTYAWNHNAIHSLLPIVVFRFITRSLSPRHTENRENFCDVVHTIFAPIPLHWKIGQIFYDSSNSRRYFWTPSNNIIESFNILKQKSYDYTFQKSWFENLNIEFSRLYYFSKRDRDIYRWPTLWLTLSLFPKTMEKTITKHRFLSSLPILHLILHLR